MPENRAADHHYERLADAMRDEIQTLVEGELGDPRIGLCHVTEVLLMPGGKTARVLVAVDGDDTEAERTLQALSAARGFVRSEVRARLGKRHVPEISFHLDRSEQVQGRIRELLERVEKRVKRGRR